MTRISYEKKHKTLKAIILIVSILMLCILCLLIYDTMTAHYASDFGFSDIMSLVDKDNDGVDDYTDIKNGALEYIATNPIYGSKYYDGGYPDDGYGVCTDVIWNAFSAAGYDLKALVDYDIANNRDSYPDIKKPDPNIDFRRVRNLLIFFERNAQKLTTEFKDPKQWQPGDIIIYEGHIGICSDKRNIRGFPYLIHHGNIIDGAVEANHIGRQKVIGHYRWN